MAQKMAKNSEERRSWKDYVNEELTVDMRPRWVRDFDRDVRSGVAYLGKRRIRILELGCSSGRWLRWFKERWPRSVAYGIDLEKPKTTKGFKFKKADARKLPYKDGTFDVIMSLGLIEHFKDKNDRRKIMNEAARVLRPGGILITTAPNLRRDSPMYWDLKIRKDPHHTYKHYRTTTRMLRRLERGAGLENISSKHHGWIFEPFGVPRVLPIPQLAQNICSVSRKP